MALVNHRRLLKGFKNSAGERLYGKEYVYTMTCEKCVKDKKGGAFNNTLISFCYIPLSFRVES